MTSQYIAGGRNVTSQYIGRRRNVTALTASIEQNTTIQQKREACLLFSKVDVTSQCRKRQVKLLFEAVKVLL